MNDTLIKGLGNQTEIGFQSLLINEFYLTHSFVGTLSHHYLLHWSGKYFESQISPRDTIIRDGVEYIVVLPTCLRKKFFESTQLKLSFRKPKYGSNLQAYVLVRFL